MIALAATLFVETIILVSAARIRHLDVGLRRLVGASILASSVTLPYVWFIFPPIAPAGWGVPSGEAFAFGIEALIYRTVLPTKWGDALLFSGLANLLSYLFGIWVLFPRM